MTGSSGSIRVLKSHILHRVARNKIIIKLVEVDTHFF